MALARTTPATTSSRALALGAAMLVLLSASRQPVAQEAPGRLADDRSLTAWVRAAETHVPAMADSAVQDVAGWSDEDLAALLPLLSNLDPGERLRITALGLLLHTDIAISHRTAMGYWLPSETRPSDILVDGTLVAEGSTTFHWSFCRQLIARLPPGTERTRIARLYYHATGALLQWWAAHGELDVHLAAAKSVLDDDAVLFLYEGTRHQVYAHPRARSYFEIAQRRIEERATLALSRDFVAPAIPSIATSRARAERAFREALRLAPALHEARVRLSHILVDRKQYREALAEIGRIPVKGRDALLNYYASVIEGRAYRGLDELGAAQEAFARAAGVYPSSHAPHLALSEIAMARGARAEARAHLASLDISGDDPWWLLPRLQIGAEQMMQQLWRALP